MCVYVFVCVSNATRTLARTAAVRAHAPARPPAGAVTALMYGRGGALALSGPTKRGMPTPEGHDACQTP